ncbi:MAG: hypothetical protein H0X13_19215 [Ramlibacter sp.]|nr:hypothetical protein [Ramlibacter sp.]
MPEALTAPYGRKTQRRPAVAEGDIIWMTAGLIRDGDSVSITADPVSQSSLNPRDLS